VKKLGVDRHITLTKNPSFTQKKLAFYQPSVDKQPAALKEQPDTFVPKEKEDDGAEELLLDALIGEACGDDDILKEPMTIQEVFDRIQSLLSDKKLEYQPRTFFDLSVLKQYTAQMLKKGRYHLDRYAASRLVAQSNHLENDGTTLARRIRALFRHFQTFGGLPAETRGGKRKGASYLDNEDVFLACRAWLMMQEIGTVTPLDFRVAVNIEILPRLLISTCTEIAQSTTYLWLRRLGFYASESKKGVYVDGHEREDVIAYRQEVFLPKMAELDLYTRRY
jgi:hypothetical protein